MGWPSLSELSYSEGAPSFSRPLREGGDFDLWAGPPFQTAKVAAAPPFSRPLRQGGEFDLAYPRKAEIKIPTLSLQRTEDKGGATSRVKRMESLGQPPRKDPLS